MQVHFVKYSKNSTGCNAPLHPSPPDAHVTNQQNKNNCQMIDLFSI